LEVSNNDFLRITFVTFCQMLSSSLGTWYVTKMDQHVNYQDPVIMTINSSLRQWYCGTILIFSHWIWNPASWYHAVHIIMCSFRPCNNILL
jgi:hypothetical protein